nr:hypothetical protein [Bacteroidota bacterium]
MLTIYSNSISSEQTCCPRCGSDMMRIPKRRFEKIVNLLSFNLFKIKRYSCYDCHHEITQTVLNRL